MRIVAIVLAAGEGRRMGGPKALLRLGDRTFLAHSASLLARPGVASVLAVLGHQAARVQADAGIPAGVVTVVNESYRAGMLTSLLAGLDAAQAAGAGAVLVHPVDHPLVDPATVDRVVAALDRGARIAVPTHGGRRGHPGGFAAAAWDALRRAAPEQGARAILAQHPEWIEHVPGNPGCIAGIDTPEDYERLIGSVKS